MFGRRRDRAWKLEVRLSVLSVVVSECGRTEYDILVSVKYSDIFVETVATGFRDKNNALPSPPLFFSFFNI
jgi:hypothetical protein